LARTRASAIDQPIAIAFSTPTTAPTIRNVRVDPPGRLREAAQELAEKIARNSPAAMAATKRALWGALEMGLTDACKAGAAELVGMWGHPDQEEGPRAFAEKREPEWQPLERPRSEPRSAP